MPEIISIHSKTEIEAFARRNIYLHIYSLGDLDDFFWPHTVWFGLRDAGQIRQLALLYTGCSMPTVLAYAEEPVQGMRELLRGILSFLPRRFYAHITQSVADALVETYHLQSHGDFQKMALTDRSRLAGVDVSQTVALTPHDRDELQAFYQEAYPANFFVPRMLQTGFYFGVRRDSTLVSVAGVHVYSQEYKVAALGNIATRPEARGQGFATATTARLCQELLKAGVEHVGLNVRADNHSAVACYQNLGFERVADYGEYTVELK